MREKPIIGSVLSIAGAIVLLLLTLTFVSNPVLLFPGVVSGLLILVFAILLYARPRGHSLWGAAVIIVSIVDILGSIFFFYAPGSSEAMLLTTLAIVSPLIALLGGIAGIIWNAPVETKSTNLR